MALKKPPKQRASRVPVAFLVGEVAFLALAYLPGVGGAARDALLLANLWCFGGFMGSLLASRKGVGK